MNLFQLQATKESARHGLKVSAYILISTILAAALSAIQSPEIRELLQDHPYIVASIPVAGAVINILIAAIERYIKSLKGENEE